MIKVVQSTYNLNKVSYIIIMYTPTRRRYSSYFKVELLRGILSFVLLARFLKRMSEKLAEQNDVLEVKMFQTESQYLQVHTVFNSPQDMRGQGHLLLHAIRENLTAVQKFLHKNKSGIIESLSLLILQLDRMKFSLPILLSTLALTRFKLHKEDSLDLARVHHLQSVE